MAETGGRATVREAVAVLEDVGELETVVEELRAAGFAEGEISLLAAHEAVERKLGRMYRRVEELEDDGAAPCTAFVSPRELGEREDRVASVLTVLPTLMPPGPWWPRPGRWRRRWSAPRSPAPRSARCSRTT